MAGRIGILDGRHVDGLTASWSALVGVSRRAVVRMVTSGSFGRVASAGRSIANGAADRGRHRLVAMALPLVGLAAVGLFNWRHAIDRERIDVLRRTTLLTIAAQHMVTARAATPDGTTRLDLLPELFAEAARDVASQAALLRIDGKALVEVARPGRPVPVSATDPAWPVASISIETRRADGPVATVDGSLLWGIRVTGVAALATAPLLVLVQGDTVTVLRDWLTDMLFPAIAAVSVTVLLWVTATQARRERRRERSQDAQRMAAAQTSQLFSEQRAQLEARLRQTEKAAALGQLSAGVAHDFNNLLHAVLLGTDGLRRAVGTMPQSGEVQRAVRLIERTAERGVALTRRMLDFARRDDTLDAGGFDPGLALGEAVELLTHSFGHGWPVPLTLPPVPLPMVAGDSATFETVVINLAINARDAMPNGGRVEVTAEPEADVHAPLLSGARAVRVVVRDTGVGMDATTLARAGEAFFSTKPAGAGTGLGLSMARGFAQRVGGLLEIASEPGVGTTVTLRLPLAAA